MNRRFVFILIAWATSFARVSSLAGQDLAITNVRGVVGNGTVSEQGSIVIRGGRIVSVSAGSTNVPGLQTIDARGTTALPGFIDAHRHVNTRPNEMEKMQQPRDTVTTYI